MRETQQHRTPASFLMERSDALESMHLDPQGAWPPPDALPVRHEYLYGYDRAQAPQPTHGETRVQRLDKAYAETLQEVRIALCGIQILFASLLNLGLTSAFAESTTPERWVYVGALACSIGAAGTLLTPAAMHRFVQGHGVKHELVTAAHRCLVAGMTFIALAISLSLVLMLDMALGPIAAVTSGIASLAWFVGLWYLGPLRTRNRTRVIRSMSATLTS